MAIPDSEAGAATRDFLNAIGESAFADTGGDAYRSGLPLQGDPNHEQAAGSPPPAQQAQEPVVTEQAPQEADFLPGMYKTKDEAIRGIHETKRYASETKAEAEALKAQMAALAAALSPQQQRVQ